MRILHLIPKLSAGGAERQLSYLASELARGGHEVHIGYSREGPERPDLIGVVLHRLESRSNYSPLLLRQLVRLIRSVKPDVVQTWILQMDILGGMAASLTGTPWIIREASCADAHPPTWKHRLRVRVASRASVIISNSEGGREYWEARLPGHRKFVVPNGLPLSDIDRASGPLPPALEQTDLPIVLSVGRLASDRTAVKNPGAFLEALGLVKERRKVLGVLCGDGPLLSELKKTRDDLGLEEDVFFTGHLPASSVWRLMKKAAALVSLSAYEGCPNAVLEAMACGCPLVISDISAHREIVDESCALFVENGARQTADAILQVLGNGSLADRRALVARQRTLGWSTAAMAREYEKIYGLVAARRSPVNGERNARGIRPGS